MRRILMTGAVLHALCLPAFGAGKLACSVDDQEVKMVLESGIAAAGERFFDFRGALTVKDETAVPANLARNRFDKTNLVQSWLQGGDLRVRVYAEAGRGDAAASVDLVVLAKGRRSSAGEYTGTYTLTVNRKDLKPAAVDGRIRCTVR